jgi:hypothetical protein
MFCFISIDSTKFSIFLLYFSKFSTWKKWKREHWWVPAQHWFELWTKQKGQKHYINTYVFIWSHILKVRLWMCTIWSHILKVRLLWMCTSCYRELCSTVVGLFGKEKNSIANREQLLLLWTRAIRGKSHYTMTRQTQQTAPLYATFCTTDNCCKISAKIVHSL